MNYVVEAGRDVQSAIDAAHAAGGGRVVLEPGVHHSSTLYLKSFVELHVSAGAKLQGGSAPEDYDDFEAEGYSGYGPEKSKKCFIAAAHAENIAITGTGEINGAGPDFFDTNVPPDSFFEKPPLPRPRMVQIYNCTNVRIEGPSFIESPNWTIWLIECKDVFVHRIRILGCQQMMTSDGIDIDSCQRVTVSDCRIRTSDDCLSIRAIPKTRDHFPVCKEIVVTNCVLNSWCNGIRVGCPKDGTIRNVAFSNIVIHSKNNGVTVDNPMRYFKADRESRLDLSNILFNNMVIECGRIPIRIFVEEGIKLRGIRGLTFSHIRIQADKSCLVQGSSETCIEDIRFLDVRCDHEFEINNARNIILQQMGNGES